LPTTTIFTVILGPLTNCGGVAAGSGVEITVIDGAAVVGIEAGCVAVTMITSGIVEVVVVGGVVVGGDAVVLVAITGEVINLVVVAATSAGVVVVVAFGEATPIRDAVITIGDLTYFPTTDFAGVVVGVFMYFPATDFAGAATVAFGFAFAQATPPNSAGTTTIATAAAMSRRDLYLLALDSRASFSIVIALVTGAPLATAFRGVST
jgi:hypothetical protein